VAGFDAGNPNPVPVLAGNGITTACDNVNIDTSLRAFVAEQSRPLCDHLWRQTFTSVNNTRYRKRSEMVQRVLLQDVAVMRGDVKWPSDYMAPGRKLALDLPVQSINFNNAPRTPAAVRSSRKRHPKVHLLFRLMEPATAA